MIALSLYIPWMFGGAFAFTTSRPRSSPLSSSRPLSFLVRPDHTQYNNKIICTALFASEDSEGDDSDDSNNYHEASVAGVSVSPKGFLVILQSDRKVDENKRKVAFPVQLTCAPDSNNNNAATNSKTSSSDDDTAKSSNISNKNLTIPSLFQENIDQTSVTSPEALTFLQLLNGVDMATPILGPDTLSLICVWYAFLLEEYEFGVAGSGGLIVEDELGLSASSDSIEPEERNDNGNNLDNRFKEAIDYIRAMVRTTLPPSKDGSYYLNYMDASPWQRARVQLPRVWLNAVRLEPLVESAESISDSIGEDDGSIGSVPIQYILECSVDDGSKLLEVPLLTMSAFDKTTLPSNMQKELDISSEILQEISHNFKVDTSASFISLALFHRYNKSGAASADSPVLKVSDSLLKQLADMNGDGRTYCWSLALDDTNSYDNDSIIIRKNGLPLYRSLSQIQEEDQRVLQHLEEQNFGKNPSATTAESSSSSGDNSSTSKQTPKEEEKKAALTLEQQAQQQRLKSAWKIAMQRNDTGALEKIQSAMEDLEKEVMKNAERGNILDDGNCMEDEDEETSLQMIQRAMQQSSSDDSDREEEEGVPGLITELEHAATIDYEDEEESVPGLISELEEAPTNHEDEKKEDK